MHSTGCTACVALALLLGACERATDRTRSEGEAQEADASAVVESGPPRDRLGSNHEHTGRAGPEHMLRPVVPDGFDSVVHSYRDAKTGVCSLRANGWVLQWELGLEERDFEFLDLWRYDPDAKKWHKLDQPKPKAVTIKTDSDRAVFGQHTDQILIELTDEPGLYWARWTEDGKLVQSPVMCGPIMPNDFSVAQPPEGMLVAGVPYENRAEVVYIADPRDFFAANLPSRAATANQPRVGRATKIDIDDRRLSPFRDELSRLTTSSTPAEIEAIFGESENVPRFISAAIESVHTLNNGWQIRIIAWPKEGGKRWNTSARYMPKPQPGQPVNVVLMDGLPIKLPDRPTDQDNNVDSR